MKLNYKAINKGRSIANKDLSSHNYSKKAINEKHEKADKGMWRGSDYNYSLNLGKAMAYGSKLHKDKKLGEIK